MKSSKAKSGKTPAKTSAPKKVSTTGKAARKPVRAAVKPAKAKVAAKPAPRAVPPRADLGAPIDGFFLKQPPALRPVCEALRTLIEAAAPEAQSSIKWGMPVFTVGSSMMAAIGAHKAHVNLILAGPPEAFDDPEGRLEGGGKTGRHLKLRTLDDLPQASVKAWLATSAALAREGKTGR